MNHLNQQRKYMNLALKLSRKGIGFTEPNPLVGAVAVKDGEIVGMGYHHKFGGPHAEREALRDVPPGTTLYVTLEPCRHYGKTPPCTDYIIEKKVSRVVAAMKDPNHLMAGEGVKILQQAGITVDVGLMENWARKINRHYITYITQKRPYVALKAGVSLDGKLTDKFRKSQWVTGPEMRTFSHSLRGEFSAIMAGSATVRDDNPALDIREPMWGDKKLVRVILDSHNSLKPESADGSPLKVLAQQDRFPTFIFSAQTAADQTPKTDNHFFIPTAPAGGLNLHTVLETLYNKGIASVMVEGGGAVIDAFLNAGLYDEIILFQAPKLLGGKDSVQLFQSGAPIEGAPEFNNREIIQLKSGQIIRAYKGE